jgi:hypothetical protein
MYFFVSIAAHMFFDALGKSSQNISLTPILLNRKGINILYYVDVLIKISIFYKLQLKHIT